jgi:DNA-3-methyladenine glycosylase
MSDIPSSTAALPRAFYDRNVEQVARDLLGTTLVARHGNVHVRGTIVETEAYGGADDPASHASFRKNGVVTAMWGSPGTLYVYAAFGVYPCFNVVTGEDGVPSAVLIRALSLWHPEIDNRVARGPGRLGRTIGLEIKHNTHPLDRSPYWIEPSPVHFDLFVNDVETGTRVGVNRDDGRPWRFWIPEHPAVSRSR